MTEVQDSFVDELKAEVNACEEAGDMDGWIKAMRRLMGFTPPGFVENIEVRQSFYDRLVEELRSFDNSMERAVKQGEGVMFQRIPITVKG